MAKPRIRIWAIVLFLFLSASAAQASTMTFTFAGSVTTVDPALAGTFSVGDTFSGVIAEGIYDAQTANDPGPDGYSIISRTTVGPPLTLTGAPVNGLLPF